MALGSRRRDPSLSADRSTRCYGRARQTSIHLARRGARSSRCWKRWTGPALVLARLVELDGLNATKDQSVRDLLHSHQYCQTPPFLRDFCTGVCTHNEVFVRSDTACPQALSQLVREDGDPYAQSEAGPLQRPRGNATAFVRRRRSAKHHVRNQPQRDTRRRALRWIPPKVPR